MVYNARENRNLVKAKEEEVHSVIASPRDVREAMLMKTHQHNYINNTRSRKTPINILTWEGNFSWVLNFDKEL